jgi:hypothetical protein
VDQTPVVIPTTEAPKAMDIGLVALTMMLCVFGFIVFLDVVTVGPATYKMLKLHCRGWKVAVLALKTKGVYWTSYPGLGSHIRGLEVISRSSNKGFGSHVLG